MSRNEALLLVLLFMTSFVIKVNPISTASAVENVPPKENSWTTMTPLPRTAGGLRAAAANGKIYVMGGSINYEYNPATDSWAAKTPMPTPRFSVGMAVYHNKIYTIAGDNGDSFNVNEVYNPTTDTWETKKPIPTNVGFGLDANVVDGKIFMIGGSNDRYSNFSVNEVYDVAEDSWTNRTLMAYPVHGYASAVAEGKIYFIGGGGGLGSSTYNQTQIYDPETDSWSLGTSIPTAMLNAAAAATTGMMASKRIYVVGGSVYGSENSIEGTGLTQVYDPENDNWTMGTAMPTARLGLTLAALNDQIYAIGGSSYLVFTPSLTAVERYTPFGYGTADPSYQPPRINLVSPKNETYYTTSVSLEFLANEAAARIYYKLDNETLAELSGNTILTGLSLGSHNLTIYAEDDAGNNAASQNIQFTVTDESEPFPTTLVAIASGASIVAAVSVGILLYVRKRGRGGSK
jgi:N-acetylneuraminic acid mutarotase